MYFIYVSVSLLLSTNYHIPMGNGKRHQRSPDFRKQPAIYRKHSLQVRDGFE